MKRSPCQGVTLLELMVAVAIVGILTAIAWPSYAEYLRRGYRATATSALLEAQQFMERYYTTNITYAGAVLPATECQNTLAARYAFAFQAAPAANQYEIQATPGGAQAADTCGMLSINQAGTRTPNTPACWR